jgi:FMN phosphatase YigB (HAD superfamily)
MAIRTVILDFDGTCTDVESEAQGFLAVYKADLARRLDRADVEEAWQEKEAQVLSDPSRHGMVLDGKIVAPPVDLYLLSAAIGCLIAPHFGDDVTERLFLDNYRYTSTAFKPESKRVIEALARADAHLFVVTNSNPTTVGAKLAQLAPEGLADIRLLGSARKFLLTEPAEHAADMRFLNVPESITLPEWDRPVYARRGHYFDALASIWKETGTTPAETLVVGDVFELDLLLPATLGCAVHLAASPRTLDYERRATEAFGGRATEDLGAVLDHLPPNEGNGFPA